MESECSFAKHNLIQRYINSGLIVMIILPRTRLAINSFPSAILYNTLNNALF